MRRTMLKSKWTKEAILAETRLYAETHDIEWRPALSRIKKDYLVEHLLLEAGYQEHAYQARELIHTRPEAQYAFDERGAELLLDPNYELPGTHRRKPEQKKLSRNARKKRARRKEAQERNSDRQRRERFIRDNT